jgi:hypothetical protein
LSVIILKEIGHQAIIARAAERYRQQRYK